ncbi:hypothetical protein [Kitasatospora camelliae]|uniref:Ig-like domain-containing protein n=1 Tax=Kitasatospora camelliae TaxID=3156397 RepID=A0AAU8JT14_9ACTN
MRARAVVLLALALPLAAGCRAFEEPSPARTSWAATDLSPSRLGDAVIARCGPGANADVLVTNPTTTPAGYTLAVAFRRPDGTLASSGVMNLQGLPAGQSQTVRIAGPAEPPGTFTCTLSTALRT